MIAAPLKVVVSMELSDGLLAHLIHPLSLVEEVTEIIIVRSREGPQLPKTSYRLVPRCFVRARVLATAWKFFAILKASIRDRPALVFSFLICPHGLIAFIAAKLTRRHYGVSLIAGSIELCGFARPTGEIFYSQAMPKPSGLSGKLGMWFLHETSLIVAAGGMTKNHLLSLGIKGEKIVRIPTVLRAEQTSSRDPGKKSFDLIYVGRLVKVKRVDQVLFLANELVHGMGRRDLRVGVVGDGFERDRLERIAQDLNLNENVTFFWPSD